VKISCIFCLTPHLDNPSTSIASFMDSTLCDQTNRPTDFL
jgi:hypothetical protein